MAEVLHLLPRDADLETRRSHRALTAAAARDDTFRPTTRTIGPGGDYTHWFWAVVALRREVARFDVVHAWDLNAVRAAARAGAKRVVFTAPASLPRRKLEAARRVARRCDLRVVHPAPGPLVGAGRAAVVRPPADDDATPLAARADVRRQLGLGDDDFVLLAPGESTRTADHERAVWVTSILHVTDERYRLLLWGRGPRLHVAARLGGRLRQPGLVVVAEAGGGPRAQFEDLLHAADAVLVTAHAPPATLPVALAMRAGVPIVAAERPELAGVLVDGETALTVPKAAPRLLAQRVLEVRENPDAIRPIVAMAEERAGELFAAAGFTAQYRTLYADLISGAPPTFSRLARAPRTADAAHTARKRAG